MIILTAFLTEREGVSKYSDDWEKMCFHRCSHFAEGNCPKQRLMERIYLIPDLVPPEEYEQACRGESCPHHPKVSKAGNE